MNFKVLLRVVVFLAILFVVLYMGINNTEQIEFSFPLIFHHRISAVAALVYFCVFAVGVLGGAVLTSGGGGGGRRSARDK